jgi:FkbM family methyltransferase
MTSLPRRIAGACADLARLGPLRRYVRRRQVVVLNVGPGAGLRFCQGHSEENHARGANELPVQEALARVLHRGGAFYDIGANVGYLTIIGARLVGSEGDVYAFEPVPANASALRRNLALNGLARAYVVEQAVSDDAGRQTLVLAHDSGGAALSIADRPPDATGAIEVDVTTVDRFVGQAGVRPPSVVKIDVEGAEINVLRGMAATLERHRPAVLVEVDGPTDARADEKARACTAFLESRGYRVERLADSYPGNRWRVQHFLAVWTRDAGPPEAGGR